MWVVPSALIGLVLWVMMFIAYVEVKEQIFSVPQVSMGHKKPGHPCWV